MALTGVLRVKAVRRVKKQGNSGLGWIGKTRRTRLTPLVGLAFPGKGKRDRMHKPVKYMEKAVTVAAKGAWVVFVRLNRIKQNPSPTPKWSEKPLLKSYEKT